MEWAGFIAGCIFNRGVSNTNPQLLHVQQRYDELQEFMFQMHVYALEVFQVS